MSVHGDRESVHVSDRVSVNDRVSDHGHGNVHVLKQEHIEQVSLPSSHISLTAMLKYEYSNEVDDKAHY